MVTTVTTNAMLDKTLYLPSLELGKIFRSQKVENVVGGKGINISLQLTELQTENIALGFLGGEVGKQIKNLLDKDKIKNDFVWVEDNTRIGFTILEDNFQQTSIFEPNHKILDDKKIELVKKCMEYATTSSTFAIAGSVPNKEISDIYKLIIDGVKKINPNCKIFLDSYGEEFKEGIKAKPFCVKQNKKEADNFANCLIKNEGDYLSVLNLYDVEFAIITNGPDYAYTKYNNNYYRVTPLPVKVVNPIGCGDVMNALFIYCFEKEKNFIDTIKYGFAAAALNAEKWRIAKNSLADIEKYIDKIIVEPLEERFYSPPIKLI
jgi:1-phosphofructokinase family hexose kinase